jgi:hypothetical protein
MECYNRKRKKEEEKTISLTAMTPSNGDMQKLSKNNL